MAGAEATDWQVTEKVTLSKLTKKAQMQGAQKTSDKSCGLKTEKND